MEGDEADDEEGVKIRMTRMTSYADINKVNKVNKVMMKYEENI